MPLPNGLKKKNLKLLGKGAQGEVYQIDATHCIKIFTHSKNSMVRELENSLKAQREPVFPKVYQWGDDYIIREYLAGVELRAYLHHHPLTEAISRQLVELIRAFERLGFTRLDTQLKNVIITPEGIIRPIDFVNSTRVSQPYPKLLLAGLAKLNMKETFLGHVKKMDRLLYRQWKKAAQQEQDQEPGQKHFC